MEMAMKRENLELSWKYKTSSKWYPAAHKIALVLRETTNQMDSFWVSFEIIFDDLENHYFINWLIISKRGCIWSDMTVWYYHLLLFNCNCNKP